MEIQNKTHFIKDFDKKTILVSRMYIAPLKTVWSAFTESNLLDQWWAPIPWKSETKTMKFEPGGFWIYAMVGPDGSKHWGRMDYSEINPLKSFLGTDSFCDENGEVIVNLPTTKWKIVFSESSKGTLVEYFLTFKTKEDQLKMVEMGFEEGVTIANEGLDKLLANMTN